MRDPRRHPPLGASNAGRADPDPVKAWSRDVKAGPRPSRLAESMASKATATTLASNRRLSTRSARRPLHHVVDGLQAPCRSPPQVPRRHAHHPLDRALSLTRFDPLVLTRFDPPSLIHRFAYARLLMRIFSKSFLTTTIDLSH
jgi:hypothetical protein